MKHRLEARQRRGFSLLEMVFATSMLATLMVAVVVLVRGGYAAWDSYERDLEVTGNGHGTLRHMLRNLRQADAVTSISESTDNSGALSVLMADGSTYSWSHDDSVDLVYFNNGGGDSLLAAKIDQLTFIGYEADGTTTTTTPENIQLVECRLQITLPHGAGTPLTLATRCWLRSW